MLNAVKKNYKAILVLLALLTIVFSSFDFPGNTKAGHDYRLTLYENTIPVDCDVP